MARRFSFRLEPLLKLRKALEKEAQRALARRMEARLALEARLEELEQGHRAARQSRTAHPGETLDLERWRAVERYLVATERAMTATRAEIVEAQAREAQAREELAQAHREHLMLLRLKERLQEVHAQDVLQDEIKAMDEMAVLRYRFSLAHASTTEAPPGR